MPLEQEVKGLIILDFIIVIALVILTMSLLIKRTKNKGLIWFLPQVGMLSLDL